MSRAPEIVDDESGVSPVIGVILMVAVTVIIAAVIGSTALGVGDSVSEMPPQTQISPEQVDDVTIYATGGGIGVYSVVEFELTGGDDIEMSNIELRVDGEVGYDIFKTSSTPDGSPDGCNDGPCHYTTTDDGTKQAGDTISVAVKQSESGTEIGSDPRGFSIRSGDILTLNPDGNGAENAVHLEDGDEVSLIWQNGDESQLLSEYEVKDPTVSRPS